MKFDFPAQTCHAGTGWYPPQKKQQFKTLYFAKYEFWFQLKEEQVTYSKIMHRRLKMPVKAKFVAF